jgi:polysaccharide biosynthesis protein PslJ
MTTTRAALTAERPAAALAGFLLGALALLSAAVASGQSDAVVGMAVATTLAVTAFALASHALLRWQSLVGGIVLLIMFIPIKRYKLFSGLPFDLEPYRLAVGLVAAVWVAALLADPRVRLRRSKLDPPLLLILAAIIGSILSNIPRIGQTVFTNPDGSTFIRESDLSVEVLKKLLFLFSFYVVFYMIVSVVRSEAAIHSVLKTLVGGAGVVAFFGLVEARTGYNVFDHIRTVLPILTFDGALTGADIARAGRARVYASSQHPIALASMMAMTLPLGIYLIRHTGQRRWMLASGLIGLGAISAVSRTSITSLAAVGLVFVWLRPAEMKRLWPLVLPALIVIHIALPGAIGGIRQSFFPSGGLVQNQTAFGGRVAPERVGPEFERIRNNPAFGAGYGTRITDGTERQNARILDDEWLGTAAETGLIGAFGWLWLFVRIIRRGGREAKRDRSSRGWLLAALASSVAAFAIGMLTYDAFSFIQVTFVFFIVAALASCTLAADGPWIRERDLTVRIPQRFRRPARNTA